MERDETNRYNIQHGRLTFEGFKMTFFHPADNWKDSLSNYTNLQVGVKKFRMQAAMAEGGLGNCTEEGDGDLQIASQDFKKLEDTQMKVPASTHAHYCSHWFEHLMMKPAGWVCRGGGCWEGQVFSSWFQRGVYQRDGLCSALGDAQRKNKVFLRSKTNSTVQDHESVALLQCTTDLLHLTGPL